MSEANNLPLLFSIAAMFCGHAIDAKCRESYVTLCENLDDLQEVAPEVLAKFSDVVIGDEDDDRRSQLRSLTNDNLPLDRMDKLTSITLLNTVKEIKPNTFLADIDHTLIQAITIYGGQLQRLKDSTFDSYSGLHKLKISNTDLEYINEGAFYNSEIRILDLSHNRLERVENNVFNFDGNNYTVEIDLRYNQIEAVYDGSFPDSLQVLQLDHNNIKVLNALVFRNLLNLRELTLNYNRLSTIPHVSNMSELTTIEASHNQIISMDMRIFTNLTNLQVLDFSYNQISYPNFFNFFARTKHNPSLQISLVFNRLTHLNLEHEVLKDHIILYYGNPWHCDCWYKMEQYMIDHKFKRNDCDVKYFSNGQTPFCYYYSENITCKEINYNYKGPKLSDADLQVFLSSINNNRELFHCDLTIRYL